MSNIPALEKSSTFLHTYWSLPRHIQRKVDRQIETLQQDVTYPGLRAKKMTDMRGVWEARVDDQYRFTFERRSGAIYLRNLGTHDILFKNP